MRRLFLILALICAWCAEAQEAFVPRDVKPIYRRSFTARYEGLAGGAPVREVAFSADSLRVGYVLDNNLWVKDLATGVEFAVTGDGFKNEIINGATDWVYEEEYGFTRAWEFSPDGGQVAWLRFDESAVPEYHLSRYDAGLYPTIYTYKYPKAGEANSVVTLWVHDFDVNRTSQKSVSAPQGGGGGAEEYYVPRIGWTPGGELFFYRVNRLQNRFEVVLVEGEECRVVYSETSPTYVERPDEGTVRFCDDGLHFVARNETRTGWWVDDLWHVDSGFVREVESDEATISALPDYPRGGRGEPTASEEAEFLSAWNDRVEDGREFFSFENDGVVLYGWMLRPAEFDAARKYPVFMTQYSGPGSESVFVEGLSRGDRAIYDPLLEAGYIVACVDPRGTGGRGEAFKKATYGRLGELETADQIAAARYLGGLEYVDHQRIGIYGWSYGGFVALNAILKGADVFAAAVAVAPVTSWRLYDTIYTETYNGLPRLNARGYDENSPVNYPELLRGKLLMIHGSGDDNVHVQNTLEMARALVEADKPFDMMIYTDDNHSMRPTGSTHVRTKIVDWVKGNL